MRCVFTKCAGARVAHLANGSLCSWTDNIGVEQLSIHIWGGADWILAVSERNGLCRGWNYAGLEQSELLSFKKSHYNYWRFVFWMYCIVPDFCGVVCRSLIQEPDSIVKIRKELSNPAGLLNATHVTDVARFCLGVLVKCTSFTNMSQFTSLISMVWTGFIPGIQALNIHPLLVMVVWNESPRRLP